MVQLINVAGQDSELTHERNLGLNHRVCSGMIVGGLNTVQVSLKSLNLQAGTHLFSLDWARTIQLPWNKRWNLNVLRFEWYMSFNMIQLSVKAIGRLIAIWSAYCASQFEAVSTSDDFEAYNMIYIYIYIYTLYIYTPIYDICCIMCISLWNDMKDYERHTFRFELQVFVQVADHVGLWDGNNMNQPVSMDERNIQNVDTWGSPIYCQCIWRFPEIGLHLVISHFRLGFSMKSTIHFGYPHFRKPSYTLDMFLSHPEAATAVAVGVQLLYSPLAAKASQRVHCGSLSKVSTGRRRCINWEK